MGRSNSILFCCLLFSCLIGVALGLTIIGHRQPRDELLFVSYESSSNITTRQQLISFSYPVVNITMAALDSYPATNVNTRVRDFTNSSLTVDFIHNNTYAFDGYLRVYGYPSD